LKTLALIAAMMEAIGEHVLLGVLTAEDGTGVLVGLGVDPPSSSST